MIEKEIFCMVFKALCEIAVWRILVNKYVGAVVGGATHLQAKPSLIVLTRRTDKERCGDKSILHNVPIVSPRRDAAVSCYSHG